VILFCWSKPNFCPFSTRSQRTTNPQSPVQWHGQNSFIEISVFPLSLC